MSHLQERKEKICLNCGAELIDRYCQKCGQENVEPKENFLHLSQHFLEDVTHFDGKFFSTIRYLITKPGFLTEEYIKGRRASYINPIRLYLFISALFFLLLMSFFLPNPESGQVSASKKAKIDSTSRKFNDASQTIESAFKDEDTTRPIKSSERFSININGKPVYTDSNISRSSKSNFLPEQTVAEYDSVQNSLKEKDRDGWFKHHYKRKMIAARQASHDNSIEWLHGFRERIMHSIPYMLFLSLPLIALLLKLLYIRRRKQFFYVSHIIFLLHYYCLVFVALIFVYTLHKIGGFANIIAGFVSLGYYVYLYVAMKRFYKQGWFKTLIKYFMLIFLGMMILTVLLIFFAANSLLNSGGI